MLPFRASGPASMASSVLYVTSQSHLCMNLNLEPQAGVLSLKTWDTFYFSFKKLLLAHHSH